MSPRPPRIGFFCGRVRVEEKLLLDAYARRGVAPVRFSEPGMTLRLDRVSGDPRWSGPEAIDLLHDRGLAFGTAGPLLEALETHGVACLNSARVVATCGDKFKSSLALARDGVPQPETYWCTSADEALRVLDEKLGYPAVLKPQIGSWGRLVARLDTRAAAEAVLEDREILGSFHHRTHYLQRLVDKPGRDLRVFVVGDEPIAAIYRTSEHWLTNTARGAKATRCPVEGEVGELALRAARAVGGGILAVDLVEDPDRGLLVLEVNHSGEFRNSIEPTGVDIPGRMVDFVLEKARERAGGGASTTSGSPTLSPSPSAEEVTA